MSEYNNISINGIAHIALSIKNLNKSKSFYKQLMPFLGLNIVHESKRSIYFIGGRTGILIQKIEKNKPNSNFPKITLVCIIFALGQEKRMKWAQDLDVVTMAEKKETKWPAVGKKRKKK